MIARYDASPRGGSVHMTECTRESLASTLIENGRGGSNLLINFIQKTGTSEKKTKAILGASYFNRKTFFKPFCNFISRPETTRIKFFYYLA